MAPRTGADSLIAPKAKALASARILLALAALAALGLLSGCGGDSSEETTAEAKTTTQGTSAPQTQSSKQASSNAAPGAKQGPGIAPPKGPPERAATPKEKANATVANVTLEGPTLGPPVGSMPSLLAKYTCDGENTWPELKWRGIPEGTEELILFTIALEPVDEALVFGWAVAGIDPSLEGIEEAKLPDGVILGRNSAGKEGYSVCPEGEAETYVFALYALPKSLDPQKGFDPMALRDAVLKESGNVGLLVTSYQRG